MSDVCVPALGPVAPENRLSVCAARKWYQLWRSLSAVAQRCGLKIRWRLSLILPMDNLIADRIRTARNATSFETVPAKNRDHFCLGVLIQNLGHTDPTTAKEFQVFLISSSSSFALSLMVDWALATSSRQSEFVSCDCVRKYTCWSILSILEYDLNWSENINT